MFVRSVSFAFLFTLCAGTQAQLVVTDTQTPLQLVENVLLGGGVTVSNVRYNGVLSPATAQVGSGSFTASGGNMSLASGVILSTGEAMSAIGPSSNFSGDGNGTGSDPDLVSISGGNINDRAVLEFDFIPTGDSLKFRYVFASEEYPEFVCSYNDAFGFFLSGPGFAGPYSGGAVNIALLPGTTVPVTIDNVNNGLNNNPNDATCPAVNPQYYIDNSTGNVVAFDGMTVVLTAFALVECGQQYHIKLAIGDALDTGFDSAVFLEAGSFTSTGQVVPTLAGGVGITGNTMLEGCNPIELIFTRLGDTTVVDTVNITVTGTATAGIDYTPAFPSQLIFPVGLETASIMLNVPIDPDGPETIIITVDQLIECSGQAVQTVFTFYIDSPPPLDVTSNNINSVCGQNNVLAPVVSGGMGQYTYLWDTGDTTPTIAVSPGVTTTYSVTVSDICGVLPVTVDFVITLPIYEPLAIAVTPATDIACLGTGPISVTSATGGNNVFTYAWTVNGIAVGSAATINVPAGPPLWYVVAVSEGCGTSELDSVLVSTTPLPPIEITTTLDPTVICSGDSTLMEVLGIVGGNGVYTLDWVDANGASLSSTYELEVGVPFDQTYTITVQDQCDNIGTASITTFIPHYAPFTLTLSADRVLCAGDSVDIHAMVSGGAGYYYILWNGPDSLTDPLYRVGPDQDTDYRVTVTDQCGEQRTDVMKVEVEHVFTSIVITNQGQDDWYLQAATLPYASTWMWDMGDSTRYRHDEVYHSYLDLDEHWVTLRIVTPNGCIGIDSVLLKPPAHLYFPNAFTPDGDGINDLFGPYGHYIDVFEMTIFDRWGEVVFNSIDPEVMWDGSVNGSSKAMTGVYVYTYRAEGHYFPAMEGIGHITLVRGSQD